MSFFGVLPKVRGSSNGGVAKLGKVYLEPIVRDAAGLFQAWRDFAYLQVYPSVRCKLEEVVMGDDLFREYRQADFYILVTPHGGVVIKKFNVKSDKRCLWWHASKGKGFKRRGSSQTWQGVS